MINLVIITLDASLLQPAQANSMSLFDALRQAARDDCEAYTTSMKQRLAALKSLGPHDAERRWEGVRWSCLTPSYKAAEDIDDLFQSGRVTEAELRGCVNETLPPNPHGSELFLGRLETCVLRYAGPRLRR